MGVGYILVNQTKRERIAFTHIAASSASEIAGNPAAAAIVAWYMLQHPNDTVAFVSDSHDDWPFTEGDKSDLQSYSEVTERIVSQLIAQGILSDHGCSYVDEDELNRVFVRDLRNAWMPDESTH